MAAMYIHTPDDASTAAYLESGYSPILRISLTIKIHYHFTINRCDGDNLSRLRGPASRG